MDSINATVQRNDIENINGTLTLNNYNISGTLSVKTHNITGVIEASRIYPVIPTQEKTATSSLVLQEVLPDANLKLSKVTIYPLPVTRTLNDKGGYTVNIGV